jgi:hypothetical protein
MRQIAINGLSSVILLWAFFSAIKGKAESGSEQPAPAEG